MTLPPQPRHVDFPLAGRVEHGDVAADAAAGQLLVPGRHCAGRAQLAQHAPSRVHAGLAKREYVLHHNLAALQSGHLCDCRDLARAVGKPGFLYDYVDGAGKC